MFKWHVASVRQIRAHVRSGIHSVEVFRLFHVALGSDRSRNRLDNFVGRSKQPWSDQIKVHTITSQCTQLHCTCYVELPQVHPNVFCVNTIKTEVKGSVVTNLVLSILLVGHAQGPLNDSGQLYCLTQFSANPLVNLAQDRQNMS